MRCLFIFGFTIFANILIFAQQNKIVNDVDFNGYIQIRGSSNFNNYSSFFVRRLKLWVKSKPNFSEHWSYKIQTTFTSLLQEKFILQDVKIGYKTGLFSFDMGQFVPQYSLQRFQADYTLPTIERASAINMLIPNGTIGVRDIGLQANFTSRNKLFETHIGLFNGYGIKEYRFNNNGFMLTNKSELNLSTGKNKLKVGYSLQFRKAENLQLHKVFPDTVLFTGNDFRYNIFLLYQYKFFSFQAEYLNANLENEIANGYYLLATFNIKTKNQIVVSYEDYNDLIQTTNNRPYIHIGYNFLIKRDEIKLYFDNYFQLINTKAKNDFASIQLQIFIK